MVSFAGTRQHDPDDPLGEADPVHRPGPPGLPGLPAGLVSRRRAPYIALLAVVLILGGLGQTPPGRHLLRTAGILGSPASYTELAFAAPKSLPREISPGSPLPQVSFMIHNSTGRARDYRWSVTLAPRPETAGQPAAPAQPAAPTKPAAPTTLTAGSLNLADGGSTTVTPQAKVACASGPVVLTVRLEGSGETLAWQADCAASDITQQG